MSKVLLGMSGGVDSTMAAEVLTRDAHEVVGVTFRFHDSPLRAAAIARAQQTAAQLGIEHHVIDMREQFNRLVKAPTSEQFARGYHFYPCAACTRDVKIPALFEQAEAFGCDKVATGHYARITTEESGYQLLNYQLRIPLDWNKDQTFLLYTLSQEQMAKIIFPLEDMHKGEVRRDAMRAGLVRLAPVNDGQGEPCFFDGVGYLRWLEGAGGLSGEPGELVYAGDRSVVGSYEKQYALEYDESLGTFPIKSLQVPEGQEEDAEPVEVIHDEELFVLHKDIEHRRILAGTRALAGTEMVMLKNVFWTSIEAPKDKRSCRVKIKYDSKALPAQIIVQEKNVIVAFNERVMGLRAGQPIVFYSDNLVLGGGIVVG